MTVSRVRTGKALTRRLAVTGCALSVGGCGLFDWIGGGDKPPLPGKREAVAVPRGGLEPPGQQNVPLTLPPPVVNAAWPQAGGNPAHIMGHLAAAEALNQAWRSGIGAGGGYRALITAQPVVSDGAVYAMDADAVVSAFDLANGGRRWRFDTQSDDDRSTNVGGGIGIDGDILYAATGRAELLALNAADGSLRWRQPLPTPARSAPTIVEGRIFLNTIDDQLVALAKDDGRKLWAYRAAGEATGVLGQPAPTYANGLVVGGFSSGEISALRATSGGVAWSDSLAASRGRVSMADLSSIRGRPIVDNARLYAVSLGNQLVAFDLRSGRRLWEREIASGQSPWGAGDWLFVVTSDQSIAAINRDDGHAGWVRTLPQYEDPEGKKGLIFWLGPVLLGDRLVVAGTNGEALSISPYTGEVLGRQSLPSKAAVAPVVAAETLLLVTDDASLIALR